MGFPKVETNAARESSGGTTRCEGTEDAVSAESTKAHSTAYDSTE
jgi:hypothetical protein